MQTAPSGRLDFDPQNALGNRAIEALLRTRRLQTRRTVSQPGDPWEQEADRIATTIVTGGAPPAVQRACTCGSGMPCEECDEAAVMRKPSAEQSARATNGANLDRVLSSAGESLRPEVLDFFQSRFDHDLSGVKVHTDPVASESARELNARAYTVGSHIVFGRGEFAPDSSEGQHLIAHELVHVVQQRGAHAPLDGDVRRQQQTQQPQPLTLTIPSSFFGETAPADYVAGPLPAGTVIQREDLTVTQIDAQRVTIEYGPSSVSIRSSADQRYAFMLEAPRVGTTPEQPGEGGLVFVGESEPPPTQRVLRITATPRVMIDEHIIDVPGMPQLVLHTRYTSDPERVYTEEMPFLTTPLFDVREVTLDGGVMQLELDQSAVRIIPPGADEVVRATDYPGAKFAYWIDPLWSGPNKTERQVVIVMSPGVRVIAGTLENVPRERGYERSLVPDVVRVPHPSLVPEQGERIDAAQFIGATTFGGVDPLAARFGAMPDRPSEVINVSTAHQGVAIAHPYSGSVVAVRPTNPSIGAAFAWQVVAPTDERPGEIRLVVGPGVFVDFAEPLPRRLRVAGGEPAPTRRERQATVGEGLEEERVRLWIVEMPETELVPPLGLPLNMEFYLARGWLRDPDSHRWLNTSDLRYQLATGFFDAAIGFIPVVGFLYDLGDFIVMLTTDHDYWGWEVTTFDKIVMGICVVIGAFTTLGVGGILRGATRASIKVADLARRLGRTPEEIEVIVRTLSRAVRPEDEAALARTLRAIDTGGELAADDIKTMQALFARIGAGEVRLPARFGAGLAAHLGEEVSGAQRLLARGGWRSVLNPETIAFLAEHPQIARAYDTMADEVRAVLTLCGSVCVLPRVVTPDQERRIGMLLKRLNPTASERELLKTHFHLAADLDEAIRTLENLGRSRQALRQGLRAEVNVADAVLRARPAWRANPVMRAKVQSILSRGMKLETFAPIMDSAAAAGEGGERMLHYVDKLVDLKNKGIRGIDQVFGSLSGGYGFFQGEEWVLRYIDRRGLWEAVERFEITAELTGARRWDARIAGAAYQFKSWRQMYGDVFIGQMLEDYRNTGGFREPLHWVFEPGRGIGSIDELIPAAEQAIRDASPGRIPENIANDIIARLRDIIVLPEVADVARSGTVIP